MTAKGWSPALWTAAWLALVVTALATRPLLPVDETRYLGVAWEMWTTGEFLVPHLNGEPYSHKPPLLFWLINLSWALFGVSEVAGRLVAPLFALGNLVLTHMLARRLWPDRPEAAMLAPIILAGGLFWGAAATLTFFDMVVGFFTLAALIGVNEACRPGGWRGWAIAGLALGLGILAKGPVILVHVLPVALAAPYWAGSRRPSSWPAWYAGLGAAVILGAALALAWALPAARAGGEAYAGAILWDQTAGRITDSFAHGGPWWFYLLVAPAAILPWILWPPVWRGLGRGIVAERGGRFCLAWGILTLAGLSAISGKQPHYLISSLPAAALLIAIAIANAGERRRFDAVAVAVLMIVVVAGLVAAGASRGATDGLLPGWTAELAPLNGLPAAAAAAFVVLFPLGDPFRRTMTLTVAAVLLVIAAHLTAAPYLARAFDLKPLARHVDKLQHAGHPLAHVSKYHGQYHFLGRLEKPIDPTWEHDVKAWAAAHPTGKIIAYHDHGIAKGSPEFVQTYRNRLVAIWDSGQVLADPSLVKR
ncbi:MAG: glycosyltransferase family 39 protein [Rhodospirillales bacterium]|jgi:4-amino-4-deoxy-L-arabinose transferase-like glycosyltransferase|nr:glycosyltransferase family 39 protein [Rhodospirillales bacterium]MDP6882766.1 glycosyltransferase family 39 protein [Rhodospirillales bacterium]